MRIQTKEHVNSRTSDGRQVSALDGRVLIADDDDPTMVELFKELVRQGLAVEMKEPKPTSAAGSKTTTQTAAQKGTTK